MLAYAVLAAMTLAGYFAAPVWLVLLGVVGLLSEGWWLKMRRLWQEPRMPWSTKITAYFVTGVAASIGLSAVAFYLGRMARVLLG